MFYVGAGAGAGASARSVDQPVHDETTRALFAHLWQSMKEVYVGVIVQLCPIILFNATSSLMTCMPGPTPNNSGSFECPVSHVPGLPTLVSHLRGHGFQPLMTGDDGKERKVYFYTEEVLEGNRVMVFLAEFKFALSAGVLTAAFKCHNPEQMEYVKVRAWSWQLRGERPSFQLFSHDEPWCWGFCTAIPFGATIQASRMSQGPDLVCVVELWFASVQQ